MTTFNKTCKQRHISIVDFDYPLPDAKIASAPLTDRSDSKLLLYQNGQIADKIFRQIPALLPTDSLLLFNDTKVVQARILFQKLEGGAQIEVFCLEPYSPSNIATAFARHDSVVFKCFIGNNKRWKGEKLSLSFSYVGKTQYFYAERLEQTEDAFLIRFSWDEISLSFAEVLELVGKIPLPPYIKRDVEEEDKVRYQTVFARYDGSVAAPTAALHFTPSLIEEIRTKNIRTAYLTLHVGAGTFKPVKSEYVGEHSMHAEYIVIPKQTIKDILASLGKPIIPVGTTCARSIESLYGFGLRCLQGKQGDGLYEWEQWDPYENYADSEIDTRTALEALLADMEKKEYTCLEGKTSLMIAPGYRWKIATGIITNFHQPKSTLLLLIASLLGDDWKNVYAYALQNNYRFLSYGDSCLFFC